MPILDIQKQIVERIEEDQHIIQGNQKLIKKQEEEIKKVMDSLWKHS